MVRKIREYKSMNSRLRLSMDDVVDLERGKIVIRYGEGGESIVWDGKNGEGKKVGSGVYEVQIIVNRGSGMVEIASKTITILGKEDKIIRDIKIIPNPVGKERRVRIRWESEREGDIKVKIYNIKGELIREIRDRIERKEVIWDIRSSKGEKITDGCYIVVMEGRDREGNIDRERGKIVILK